MRFPDKNARRRLVRTGLLLTGVAALSSCGSSFQNRSVANITDAALVTGPQADYPVVVGQPYEVQGKTFTPADVLNYDEVGYAIAAGGEGVTGTHHTLPLPSYVEVTSLETGRTILVRLEERGPMGSTHLLGLSPEAILQLGSGIETPVRVRRVNPPEEQRAMLRSDMRAPLRMDTPMTLVEVLRRRLPDAVRTSLQATTVQPDNSIATAPSGPPAAAEPVPTEEPGESQGAEFARTFADVDEVSESEQISRVAVPPAQVAQNAEGEGFVVQAAAFSTEERAERAATALGGRVTQAGRYWRVRTGPFATRDEAEASLAKVQAAGYSDARIYTNG